MQELGDNTLWLLFLSLELLIPPLLLSKTISSDASCSAESNTSLELISSHIESLRLHVHELNKHLLLHSSNSSLIIMFDKPSVVIKDKFLQCTDLHHVAASHQISVAKITDLEILTNLQNIVTNFNSSIMTEINLQKVIIKPEKDLLASLNKVWHINECDSEFFKPWQDYILNVIQIHLPTNLSSSWNDVVHEGKNAEDQGSISKFGYEINNFDSVTCSRNYNIGQISNNTSVFESSYIVNKHENPNSVDESNTLLSCASTSNVSMDIEHKTGISASMDLVNVKNEILDSECKPPIIGLFNDGSNAYLKMETKQDPDEPLLFTGIENEDVLTSVDQFSSGIEIDHQTNIINDVSSFTNNSNNLVSNKLSNKMCDDLFHYEYAHYPDEKLANAFQVSKLFDRSLRKTENKNFEHPEFMTTKDVHSDKKHLPSKCANAKVLMLENSLVGNAKRGSVFTRLDLTNLDMNVFRSVHSIKSSDDKSLNSLSGNEKSLQKYQSILITGFPNDMSKTLIYDLFSCCGKIKALTIEAINSGQFSVSCTFINEECQHRCIRVMNKLILTQNKENTWSTKLDNNLLYKKQAILKAMEVSPNWPLIHMTSKIIDGDTSCLSKIEKCFQLYAAKLASSKLSLEKYDEIGSETEVHQQLNGLPLMSLTKYNKKINSSKNQKIDFFENGSNLALFQQGSKFNSNRITENINLNIKNLNFMNKALTAPKNVLLDMVKNIDQSVCNDSVSCIEFDSSKIKPTEHMLKVDLITPSRKNIGKEENKNSGCNSSKSDIVTTATKKLSYATQFSNNSPKSNIISDSVESLLSFESRSYLEFNSCGLNNDSNNRNCSTETLELAITRTNPLVSRDLMLLLLKIFNVKVLHDAMEGKLSFNLCLKFFY